MGILLWVSTPCVPPIPDVGVGIGEKLGVGVRREVNVGDGV